MVDAEGQTPLAHSPPKDGTPGDPYARHINAVRHGARARAEAMLRYASSKQTGLLDAIESAANFHDLGKLDPDIQAVFRKGRGSRLKWDHIDAGVAHLASMQDWMAAWIVRAHHAPGLPRKAAHFTDKTDRRLRGRRNDATESLERHEAQIRHTNLLLARYLSKHEETVGKCGTNKRRPIHGLTMRLALSCLVDADHSDSAFFDSGILPPDPPGARWIERLEALKAYVEGLPSGKSDEERGRNQGRNEFFYSCLNSPITAPIVACEGSVGLGKTTAVTAYLLRRAAEDGLRRLIIVAPFTNILTQTAERLRKALVLPDENPYEVIVEHHHRADFSHIADRDLAALWHAPIVLTTAVSFFETLSACHPASLRKLHALPGSAVFIDEAHAALPVNLWPLNWSWLHALADLWKCRFVLASGSLSLFWEHEEVIKSPEKIPELLPTKQATNVLTAERVRVSFVQACEGRVIELSELVERVHEEDGPRLVILNTVQNAAIAARAMRSAGMNVLHLSTALTPSDRARILSEVESRLATGELRDWTLVATSCVEAGVDLSFRSAFRERFCVASTIQVGGRVNRHGEFNAFGGGKVIDFALTGPGITQHPGASGSSDILRDFMSNNLLNTMSPADVVTRALVDELRYRGGLSSELLEAEKQRDYPRVQDLGRVIQADTRFVVVDKFLQEALGRRDQIDFKALLQGSVQLWARKIDKLRLQSVPGRADIYAWNYEYDPKFLGYMDGVLKLDRFLAEGGAII